MKTQDQLKAQVAQAAVDYLLPQLQATDILGIGTGSTMDLFIDALAVHRHCFSGAVASSERTAERLRRHGITVLDLNDVSHMPFYIDGADEINPALQMVKGGGGALTREKIVASVADRFICIVDDSKWVSQLGQFPVPIEVLPMAVASVSRQLQRLGGQVCLREGVITDNGNPIIDVAGWSLADARALESQINQLPGVVCCGFFAQQPASVVLIASQQGVRLECAPND